MNHKVHLGIASSYMQYGERQGIKIKGYKQPQLKVHGPSVSYTDMDYTTHVIEQFGRASQFDPLTHFSVGKESAIGTFGPLQYLMISRKNVREMLFDIIAHTRVLSDYYIYTLEEVGTDAIFTKHPRAANLSSLFE